MRLEELKDEFPRTPIFIQTMIRQEVDRNLNDNRRGIEKKIPWKFKRVAAIILACVFGTSTMVFAASKLYHMRLEKDGTYQIETKIEQENTLQVPEYIHGITIQADYIPDGMVWTEEGVKMSNKETLCQGGFSIITVLMDTKDVVMHDINVVESEEFAFGEHEGVYLKYHDLLEDKSFNQRIYMLYPELYQVVIIFVGDDVAKEEAMKFAQNLKIIENSELLKTAELVTWSDICEGQDQEIAYQENYIEENMPSVKEENLLVHEIGETFAIDEAHGEDNDGNYIETNGITVRVDDVQIADNLQLVEGATLPEEWENVTDENGKIVQNHLSYIKEGDGIATLDQIVREEDVNQKLLYVTVTYTNTTDSTINHMCYCGVLTTLRRQEDGIYVEYVQMDAPGDGYDYIRGSSDARLMEMQYYSARERYGDGGNYISLEPGESIEIQMGWIVNEFDLENLYLSLSGYGASLLQKHDLRTGYVYVGDR